MLIPIKTLQYLCYWQRLAFLLLFVALPVLASAQSFDLQVTVTNETCAGNGTLTFGVTGAAASPAVNYKVYLLPDTVTPIANGTATTLGGQQAGQYLVVATQTVNGVTRTDEQTVEIEYQGASLSYTVSGSPALCGNDGVINVHINSGAAASYEIISGPVIRPPQSSNSFTGLPAGFYKIRVTDPCGSAQVVEYNLFSNQSVLEVSDTALPDTSLPGCDLITVSHFITHTSVAVITYPLSAVLTVYPPDGSTPFTYNLYVATDDPDSCIMDQVIPFYYDTPYYYDFVLTDGCGNQYPKLQNLVDAKLGATLVFVPATCNKALLVTVTKFVPPYTFTFTQYPPGFEPEVLNPQYPGPFSGTEVQFGDNENNIPNGPYAITLTDACGRTVQTQAELVPDPDPIATYTAANNDCLNNLGLAQVMVTPKTIESVFITSAPIEYAQPANLPQDVTEYSSGPDGLSMQNLPPGTYIFEIIDNCGFEYPPLTVIVPPYTNSSASVISRPDCTPGMASVMLGSGLNAASVTAAPDDFPYPLPYDVTSQLDISGNAYLDGLPPGTYTFSLNSTCFTTPASRTTQLIGNTTSLNDFRYTPYCGAFDLEMYHTATPNASVTFWLQREYGNGTGNWGHPNGNQLYTTGVPAASNSLILFNNYNNTNLQYPTGHYRVVKTFKAFSPDGENGQKTCFEVIYEFTYQTGLQITGARNLTCEGPADVEISATGVQPFTYTIIEKDGVTVNIPNGNNNIFTALDPATYTILVADPCGNQEPIIFNIANLPSLVSASTAPALTLCDNDGDGSETFDLSQQDSSVLDGQDAALVSISYHTSMSDAVNRLNPLPLNYTTTTRVIYARAEHLSNINLCYAVSSFSVIVNRKPVLNMATTVYGCEGVPNTITATPGYASYLWSTGETTQTIHPEQAGIYTVTITDSKGCKADADITLSTSSPPEVLAIDTTDWTDSNNTITVVLATPQGSDNNPEFSVDGINWQSSNIFTGLKPGKYNVYVRDRNGCGFYGSDSVFLLMYPKFFTPNGDNVNEHWRIRFASNAEPDLTVKIYDRFGKLITGFDSRSIGWDGTLNGYPLPSTDYWFVVKRKDGKEYRGHFAMIR